MSDLTADLDFREKIWYISTAADISN